MYYLQRKTYTQNFNASDFILLCWKETFSKILNEMGRNWNRKSSENTQDKGWKRKERFQTYLKRNVKKENRHKASNRNISKQKTFPNPPKKIHKSFRATRRRTTTQKPKLGIEGALLLRVANKVPPAREQGSQTWEQRSPIRERVLTLGDLVLWFGELFAIG